MPLAPMRIGAILVLICAATPASAQSAEVAGKLGYISEWEITAQVAPRDKAGREFSGPLTVRHVGLCAADRPVEMTGEIRYRIAGWPSRRMDATLVIDGAECGFEGRLGQAYEGVLSCQQWRGVPLSLSLKTAN